MQAFLPTRLLPAVPLTEVTPVEGREDLEPVGERRVAAGQRALGPADEVQDRLIVEQVGAGDRLGVGVQLPEQEIEVGREVHLHVPGPVGELQPVRGVAFASRPRVDLLHGGRDEHLPLAQDAVDARTTMSTSSHCAPQARRREVDARPCARSHPWRRRPGSATRSRRLVFQLVVEPAVRRGRLAILAGVRAASLKFLSSPQLATTWSAQVRALRVQAHAEAAVVGVEVPGSLEDGVLGAARREVAVGPRLEEVVLVGVAGVRRRVLSVSLPLKSRSLRAAGGEVGGVEGRSPRRRPARGGTR